jgi:hypothetical protein
MKIEVVPLAGLILGVLFFDQKWQDQEEQTFFEIVICLGILGIKFRWYDS